MVRRVAKTQAIGYSMPTVLRADGCRVVIFLPTREHPPPHVHVFPSPSVEVVVWLGEAGERPSLRDVRGGGPRDAARALRVVRTHIDHLRRRWSALHGED